MLAHNAHKALMAPMGHIPSLPVMKAAIAQVVSVRGK